MSLSRRGFLRGATGAAGAVALGPLLAACSRGGGVDDPARVVHFANWPLYLDRRVDDAGNQLRPSLERFTRETGIDVNYREVIPDAETFYHEIQPYLAAGAPTGWDIMVITNGPTLTKLIQQGQVEPLPADRRPNFDANALPELRDPAYDPGSRHTMPWQSGITGIAYNPQLTGRSITSLADLFSEEFAGQVGMFGDAVDMPNLAMVAAGVDPATSTPADWRDAAGLLRRQREAGIVGSYYLQNYVRALTSGEVAISMAWSGDIFQKNTTGDPDGLQFVVPDEGAILWTDAMVIPKGAAHQADALTLMDFVYRPAIAALISGYVAYVSPVVGTDTELVRLADRVEDPATADAYRAIAGSPLCFPSADERAGLRTYRELTTDAELAKWNEIFGEFFVG